MGLHSLVNNKTYLLFALCVLQVGTFGSESRVLDQGRVQALYVFGDSLVDAGNNNDFMRAPKANHIPYGIDFEGAKPTGRCTNGKTITDYIAVYYRLPLVPPYLGLTPQERFKISTGFNYASAACGILPDTGNRTGLCLPLSTQVLLFNLTVKVDLPNVFETKEELQRHLSESLFLANVGVNDFTYFYLYNEDQTDPQAFADMLLGRYLTELRNLYDLGARRFFVNNIKPLGCYPNMMLETTPPGSCNETINKGINYYNMKLKDSLINLRRELPGTSFVYSDYFNFMLALRNSGDLNVVNPCCPQDYDGTNTCSEGTTPCPSRYTHMFFDPFHPTEIANFGFAVRCFDETKTEICQVLEDTKTF